MKAEKMYNSYSGRNKTKENFSPKRGLGQQEKKALLAIEN